MTDKTPTLRKELRICERAQKIFAFYTYSKTAISFNILLVLQILCFSKVSLQLHLHTYTISAVSLLTVYGTIINDSC